MRSAILGDIHANLQALEAVVADARAYGCTEFLCLGDIVGYNANPTECLEIVRSLPGTCVLGNHDEAAADENSLEYFSSAAAVSLEWTRSQLSTEQKSWLSGLRPMRQIRNSTLVHATLDSPKSWAYVRNAASAELSFSCQRTPIAFFGHTHLPGLFVQRGEAELLSEEGIEIPHDRKVFINAGSVGQPRDGDWRASYLIHDEDLSGIWLRRVEYDIQDAQHSILNAGLPEKLAARLSEGS